MDTMTIPEVAARLRVSVDTLRKMRKAGMLPPHNSHTPTSFEWRKDDIEAFAGCWPRNMTEYNKLNRH